MRYLFLFLVILIGLMACKKNPTNGNSLWHCNDVQFLDSVEISTRLIGSWNWSKQVCGDGAGKIKNADKSIRVTFDNDHTFSVYENETSLINGTWELVQVDGDSRGLALSSPSEYLYGRFLFCNNQVMFNNSYIDGCDNLFVKSNQ